MVNDLKDWYLEVINENSNVGGDVPGIGKMTSL
jgi:hypothetical protein